MRPQFSCTEGLEAARALTKNFGPRGSDLSRTQTAGALGQKHFIRNGGEIEPGIPARGVFA